MIPRRTRDRCVRVYAACMLDARDEGRRWGNGGRVERSGGGNHACLEERSFLDAGFILHGGMSDARSEEDANRSSREAQEFVSRASESASLSRS